MPRKTVVNPDEGAMRGHGAHVWHTSQDFWCFCSIGKDHSSQPRFTNDTD